MATLTIAPVGAAGSNRAGQATIALVNGTTLERVNGYLTADDSPVVYPETVAIPATGTVDVDLTPNASISPANTCYLITIRGAAEPYLITKGSGTETLYEALETSPEDLASLGDEIPDLDAMGTIADADLYAAYQVGAGTVKGNHAALATYVGTKLALSTTYQPLDSDLSAIAALSTTAYGRALLALADAAAADWYAKAGGTLTGNIVINTAGGAQVTGQVSGVSQYAMFIGNLGVPAVGIIDQVNTRNHLLMTGGVAGSAVSSFLDSVRVKIGSGQSNVNPPLGIMNTSDVIIAGIDVLGRYLNPVGTTNTFARSGGRLVANTTAVGNVGTGEDNLIATTVAANTLTVNGDALEFEMAFTIANNVNAKRLRVKWGATTILDTAATIPTSTATTIIVHGSIIRTGAATQKVSVLVHSPVAAIAALSGISTTAAETLTSASVLRATGEATSNNDILNDFTLIDWRSSP